MAEALLALGLAGAMAGGGYNEYKQNQSLCSQYNDLVDQMNTFNDTSTKLLENLEEIDEYYYQQSIDLLSQIADIHQTTRTTQNQFKVTYTIMQIVVLGLLVVVAMAFILKRKGLLTSRPLG